MADGRTAWRAVGTELVRDAGRGRVLLLAVLLVVAGLVPAAAAAMLGVLVAAVQRPDSAPAPVLVLVLVFGVVLLIGHVAESLAAPLQYLVRSRIDGAHRRRLADLLSSQPTIEHIEDPAVRAAVRTARADPENWFERTPGDGALAVLVAATQTIGALTALVILIEYAWWSLMLLPAAVAIEYLRGRRALRSTATLRQGLGEWLHAEVWQQALIDPGKGKDLRVYGLGDFAVRRIQHHISLVCVPVWDAMVRTVTGQWLPLLLIAVPLGLLDGSAAADATHGTVSAALLATVLAAGWAVFQGLQQGDRARDVAGALQSIKGLRFIQARMKPNASGAPVSSPLAAVQPPAVAFEGVRFRYPEAARDVLADLDLRVRPGELLAVVGLNGAGKSTLIKLMSGLYEPTEGRITVDGRQLTAQDMEAWRARLFVVFQDFVHYQLPVRDNIVLGNGRVAPDEAALRTALEDSGLAEVLSRQGIGLDTPLTRGRTGGVDLSGGQWQRVVVARALYAFHTGARLLVLDEPTAHLDIRSEMEVFQRLTAYRGSATVVLVSHRLSTVRQADRIVVLDGGRIAESGTHEELMDQGGTYASMFAIQAERFLQGRDDRVEGGDLG
ncbi:MULTISPECIES: ATP-binding cassette domain-containing protein [unclassified Streptomyces]|uniref:ATP-binding cassette domain-containing protein n=1 Tax=unclassified Streptomyces TaxID=2593676 RepID=UPI002258508E|nr:MULTISPECIES: ATP-binding cassette domain-containing protein [unclassified Streptomyces]MCX5053053.1 ATP-binding cassette domain-containing protein [Streptomyces sp. NBC_00474]